MIIIGYMAALIMGLSLGLIGGGGSILTVPILVYFFSTDPIRATSESLFVVGSTALLGAVMAYQKGEVHFKTVLQFAVPSFFGVFVMKKFIFPNVPDLLFLLGNIKMTKPFLVMIIFAVLMLAASLTMIFRRQKKILKNENDKSKGLKVAIQGFFVGQVTGLVGAGGGFLIVPALVNLLQLNMRSAIGSSLMIIAMNSLFGFTVALTSGLHVDWSTLFSILGLSFLGLIIGRKYSQKISEEKLKKGFGYFVLIMGCFILFDQIQHLKL